MKNLKNNLKKNKKGFTLVEIIVVLVILAILAAAAIPTMIGFVEDSKGKSEIANARAAYVAAQSVVTEETATNVDTETTKLTAAEGYEITGSGSATKFEKMVGKDLAGAKVRVTDKSSAAVGNVGDADYKPATSKDGKIDTLEYLSKSGYLVTINVGGDTVSKKATVLP